MRPTDAIARGAPHPPIGRCAVVHHPEQTALVLSLIDGPFVSYSLGVLTMTVRRFAFLSLAVAALLASVLGARGASAQAPFTCAGLNPTIIGNGADIFGTGGPDVIVGSAAGETIYGFGGDDIICGEGGNDAIHGGAGNDRLWGEASGVDDLDGDETDDVLYGESGNDLLVDRTGLILDAGSGDDEVFGTGEILGGSGNDSLVFAFVPEGQSGEFILNGGSGKDSCNESNVRATLISCEIV